MSIFKELIHWTEPLLETLGTHWQPSNPLYALQRADECVSEGIEPVCVILGQDPYPQKGVPTGLAFANSLEYVVKNKGKLSPSLQVIFDSLKRLSLKDAENSSIPYKVPVFDPTLETWVDQGIVLLNSSLTVEPNKPGSHQMFWAPHMKSMIEAISQEYPDLCWILLGSYAGLFDRCIAKSCFVVKDNHPARYIREVREMPVYVWEKSREYCKVFLGKEIHWWE